MDVSNDENNSENGTPTDNKPGKLLFFPLQFSYFARGLLTEYAFRNISFHLFFIFFHSAIFDAKPSIESNDEDLKNVEIKAESDKGKSNGAGLKSSLTLFRTKNKPKKSVKWKMDDELEMVQYFEMDVSERSEKAYSLVFVFFFYRIRELVTKFSF